LAGADEMNDYNASWLERLYEQHPKKAVAGLFSFVLMVCLLALAISHFSKSVVPSLVKAVEGFPMVEGELLVEPGLKSSTMSKSDQILSTIRYDAGVGNTVYLPESTAPQEKGQNFFYMTVGRNLTDKTQKKLKEELLKIDGVLYVHVGKFGVAVEKRYDPNELDRPLKSITFPWKDASRPTDISREVKRIFIEVLRRQVESENKKTGASNRDPSFCIFVYIITLTPSTVECAPHK